MKGSILPTGRLPGLIELKTQEMVTGLSHSKGELKIEEPAGACHRKRARVSIPLGLHPA
jgi:hypothetical protein